MQYILVFMIKCLFIIRKSKPSISWASVVSYLKIQFFQQEIIYMTFGENLRIWEKYM